MKTTIDKGAELRDRLANLLRVKYREVEVEKRLASTTADVYFIDQTGFCSQRIAIEAKNLTRSVNIAEIYKSYFPSIAQGEIDLLIIVGNKPLSSSPRNTISNMPKVRYMTVDDFMFELMSFSDLLTHNILAFRNSEACSNFMIGRDRNTGESLQSVVERWCNSDKLGLLIYGGYGLGKTTFSIYVASYLSDSFLAKRFGRIPIRISLGGIYTKHDFPSLICSSFTSGEVFPPVSGFSYNLFLEMNRIGRFLILLDGFDEMRHAMDMHDFVFTFQQLRSLFVGDAKIIILGRPDAFFSGQDEDRVVQAFLNPGDTKYQAVDQAELDFLFQDRNKTVSLALPI